MPTSRLERFDNCGTDCVVEFSPTACRHRVRATYCGDRFCQPCCQSRALKIRENLKAWTEGGPVRTMEFTLRADGQPLAKRLDRLLRCFAKLRAQLFWRAAVTAGCYVVEIKRGKGSGEWHPHLHVLVQGNYVDHSDLRRGWLKATGDSSIVYVQAVKQSADALSYASKYASKGWTQEVAEDHESLIECVLALRGRRLLGTFGQWRNRQLECGPDRVTDWRRVGRLETLFADAAEGRTYAIGALKSLGVRATVMRPGACVIVVKDVPAVSASPPLPAEAAGAQ